MVSRSREGVTSQEIGGARMHLKFGQITELFSVSFLGWA